MAFPFAQLAMMAVGALAGSQPKRETTSVNLAPVGQLEGLAGTVSTEQLQQLQALLGAGPGQAEVAAGLSGQQSFIDLLRQTLAQGAQPTQADITQAGTLAQQIFQPQRTAMQQQFTDQQRAMAQQAALLGRTVSDPILQARLAQEQTRQSAQLESQIGSFATQQAMQQPFTRLNIGAQLAQTQATLANQALANRQALLSLGSQIRGQEQQFRAGTATRTTSGGGGLAAGISGGLAGLGLGMTPQFGQFASGVTDWLGGLAGGTGNMFSNLFGGQQGGAFGFVNNPRGP